MNTLNIELKSVKVEAKTRKLRAEWTPEMAHDISTMIDWDSYWEFYILREIRREKIDRILSKF